ncbi:MAG TPA: hypothetical protein VM936_10805 [Pyrinomonadaceae bacterium]|jgi:hypothetical protein|nr:hypothetical protein [Pyrinomonadaceae bacterium]
MINWEELKHDRRGHMYRAKVLGGWLIWLDMSDGSSVTFYPDPYHTWDGGSLP